MIPISDKTVERWIYAITDDEDSMLRGKLHNSPAYALYMDVRTKGENAHSLIFVHYMK